MGWFSRKSARYNDVQRIAIQVHRALKWQIQTAKDMTQEADLSLFYEKDLVLGYFCGFLSYFQKRFSVGDEKTFCMMLGSACSEARNDGSAVDRAREVGAALNRLAIGRRTVHAKSFLAGESMGSRDCEQFLHEPDTAPTGLVELLVTEARIQQRGTNIDTNQIVSEPAFGEGYYRELIKNLIRETGSLMREVQDQLFDFTTAYPALGQAKIDHTELCWFAMSATTWLYTMYSKENERQKENALEDYRSRLIGGIWNVYGTTGKIEQVPHEQRKALENTFANRFAVYCELLSRATADDKESLVLLSGVMLNTIVSHDAADDFDMYCDLAQRLHGIVLRYHDKVRTVVQ